MKPAFISISAALLALLLIAAAPGDKGKGGQGAGPGGQVEPAVVPPYLFNVWLCRAGAESVSVSVLAWEDMEAFISFGETPESLTKRSEVIKLAAGMPQTLALGGLEPDAGYSYQLTHRRPVAKLDTG